MVFIIKNPRVQDYFIDVDYQDAIAKPEGIAPLYEDGNFIFLKGHRLDLDYDFLNTVSMEPALEGLEHSDQKRIQKLSYKQILSLNPGLFGVGNLFQNNLQKAIYQQAFEGNRQRFLYFQEQVKRGHQLVMDLFHKLFPGYEPIEVKGTWRFVPTLFENLHWDSFPDLDDRHQARIFINIDKNPRVWHTSHPLEPFVQEHYEKLGLAELKGENPNKVIGRIDKKFLGGMAKRCLDGLDRHALAFEQGEIWLADSRLISHQIYQGNRALIYMFHIKPESMHNPEKRFNRRIEALHQQHSHA